MGISMSTVNWLRTQGYDVLHLSEEGLQRAADKEILEKAGTEERVVLTLDLGFGELLAVSGRILPSVVSFRLGDSSVDVVTQRLKDVLAECQEHLEEGAIISVTETVIRVRSLPI
jgi:predicted nuclease of predicted toxin-antitoxin system